MCTEHGYRIAVGQAVEVAAAAAAVAGRVAVVLDTVAHSKVAIRAATGQDNSNGAAVRPVGRPGTEVQLAEDGARKAAGHSKVINSPPGQDK